MAHEIFNEKFFNKGRQPAWHGLGITSEEDLTAREAFTRVGRYTVAMEALVTESGIPVSERAVVRHPEVPGAPPEVLGVVGGEYNLISPDKFCEIWDQAVNRPVETLGVLKRGRILFIATSLPTASVKGDEVQNYLLLAGHIGDGFSNECMVSSVRTVCMNTLRLARRRVSEFCSVDHRRDAAPRLWTWLHGAYERAEAKARVLTDAYRILADFRVNDLEEAYVFSQTYPMPEKPVEDLPESILRERLLTWDQSCVLAKTRRMQAHELFAGRGTGMDTEAAQGTLWGAFNAVTELEDYRHRRADGSSAEDALFGLRAEAKARAFEACTALSGRISD